MYQTLNCVTERRSIIKVSLWKRFNCIFTSTIQSMDDYAFQFYVFQFYDVSFTNVFFSKWNVRKTPWSAKIFPIVQIQIVRRLSQCVSEILFGKSNNVQVLVIHSVYTVKKLSKKSLNSFGFEHTLLIYNHFKWINSCQYSKCWLKQQWLQEVIYQCWFPVRPKIL